jgi:alpha-mannosidase
MSRDLAGYTRATGITEMMHLYGVGDHGGGPTRQMLESARQWQSPEAIYPSLSLSTAQAFFEQITPKLAGGNVPVWKNELYLEYHRGTYTTQAQTKKNNRRNVELLLNAEKFSSLAFLFGQPYRQEDLSSAWRKLLFNQFHDILPGSGIPVVYRDAARDQAEVRRLGQEILSGSLDELSARVRTEGPGVPVIVFNPLAWPRTDVVEVKVGFPGAPTGIEVRDARGRAVLADVVARDPEVRKATVRFLAEDVPSLGYEVFHVVPVKNPTVPVSSLKAQGYTIENEFLRVQVDPKSGCITSLLDKVQAREELAAGACGNLLQAFRDKPRDWDAWNIDADFEDQKWDLMQADDVRLVESGSARVVLRVLKKFQDSRFVQDLTLYPKVPRLDVRMEAAWHEDHVLLKVAFPVAVQSDVATFEIPYGTIERPTRRRTPEEKAKFEVPALRWADLSAATHGVSLLNDSKYGSDVRDNVLRLSLLRSPAWPDAQADRGHHEFIYSLYPHAGTWKEAGTFRRGYELNYRLLPVVTDAHGGSLPPAQSFFAIEPENVVLTAIKKAEEDKTLIFRFVQLAGGETQVRLRLPADATRAVETDLQEREEHELPLRGREVVLPSRPYEIKTVKVQFAASAK